MSEKKTCPECSGEKVVYNPGFVNCGTYGMETCLDCKGTGEVDA